MTINQKVKNERKTVYLLTDAQPRFVSLVNHGANQTPFKTLKCAQPLETEDMPTKVSKITFAKDVYKSVEECQAWMTAKGFEVPEADKFAEADGVFAVTNSETVEGAKAVKADDKGSVTYYLIEEETVVKAAEEAAETETAADAEVVADPEANADEAEPVEKVEKALKDLKQKTDLWASWAADSDSHQSIGSLLAAGADGQPIGMGEILYLYNLAIENAVLSGNAEKVKEIADEFIKAYSVLQNVTSQLMTTLESKMTKETEQTTNETPVEAVAKTDETVSTEVAAEAVTEETTETAAETAAEVENATKSPDEVAALTEDTVAKMIAEAVAKALETTAKKQEELEATNKELAEKVTSMETAEQSRKSAAEDYASREATQKRAEPTTARRFMNDTMGIR